MSTLSAKPSGEEAEQRAEAFQTERYDWQQRYSDAKAAYQQATQARDQQRAELSQHQGELASLKALIDAALAITTRSERCISGSPGLADAATSW